MMTASHQQSVTMNDVTNIQHFLAHAADLPKILQTNNNNKYYWHISSLQYPVNGYSAITTATLWYHTLVKSMLKLKSLNFFFLCWIKRIVFKASMLKLNTQLIDKFLSTIRNKL